jgi:hypothetical protein
MHGRKVIGGIGPTELLVKEGPSFVHCATVRDSVNVQPEADPAIIDRVMVGDLVLCECR